LPFADARFPCFAPDELSTPHLPPTTRSYSTTTASQFESPLTALRDQLTLYREVNLRCAGRETL
jgi:hypothetical protein